MILSLPHNLQELDDKITTVLSLGYLWHYQYCLIFRKCMIWSLLCNIQEIGDMISKVWSSKGFMIWSLLCNLQEVDDMITSVLSSGYCWHDHYCVIFRSLMIWSLLWNLQEIDDMITNVLSSGDWWYDHYCGQEWGLEDQLLRV